MFVWVCVKRMGEPHRLCVWYNNACMFVAHVPHYINVYAMLPEPSILHSWWLAARGVALCATRLPLHSVRACT